MAGKLPSRIQRRVDKHVKSGRFETAEDVLVEALRLLDERQAEVRALDKKIQRAVDRGLADIRAGRSVPLEELSVQRIREGTTARRASELRELVKDADRSIARNGVIPARAVVDRSRSRVAASPTRARRLGHA